MRVFHFMREKKSRSFFLNTNLSMPLTIVVADGKRHIVGIGELGDKTAVVEKVKIPFVKREEIEDVVKDLLMKLRVPQSEWDEVLKSRREVTLGS